MQKKSHTTHKDGRGAIIAAFSANIGIAIGKFVAFMITGSAAMLAEAAHSVVDSSNQILLVIGIKQSRRKPTKTHPFGYGRAHFLYAFMVSIVLFSLGGVFAIYQGVEKIQNPEMIDYPMVAYGVLALAALLEGLALRKALSEARSFKPKSQSWWQFLQQTKSVNHVVLALEDSSALIGLTFAAIGISLALVTGNPIWDGIGTLFIGALLICVAVILFREVKSLLIGEAVNATNERKMREIILGVEGVDKLVDLKTLYTGPMELFVAMKIIVGPEDSARYVSKTIDEVEAKIRKDFPIARLIYVEPDFYKTKQQQRKSDTAIKKAIEE